METRLRGSKGCAFSGVLRFGLSLLPGWRRKLSPEGPGQRPACALAKDQLPGRDRTLPDDRKTAGPRQTDGDLIVTEPLPRARGRAQRFL